MTVYVLCEFIQSNLSNWTKHNTPQHLLILLLEFCRAHSKWNIYRVLCIYLDHHSVRFCSVVLSSFGHSLSLVTRSLMHTNTHVSRRTLTSKMLHKTNLQVFLWFSEYSCRYVVILIISALWIYANVFVYVYKYSPMYSTLRGKRLINKFVAQHLWIGCLHVCVWQCYSGWYVFYMFYFWGTHKIGNMFGFSFVCNISQEKPVQVQRTNHIGKAFSSNFYVRFVSFRLFFVSLFHCDFLWIFM